MVDFRTRTLSTGTLRSDHSLGGLVQHSTLIGSAARSGSELAARDPLSASSGDQGDSDTAAGEMSRTTLTCGGVDVRRLSTRATSHGVQRWWHHAGAINRGAGVSIRTNMPTASSLRASLSARRAGSDIHASKRVRASARKTAATISRGISHVALSVAVAVRGLAAAGPMGWLVGVMALLLGLMLVVPVMGLAGSNEPGIVAPGRGVAGFIGDDYPWKDRVRDSSGNPGGLYNEMNPATQYAYGNCTDFAFWRVNRDMGHTDPHDWYWSWSTLTPHGGDGGSWGLDGNMPGWNRVTSTAAATPGDIISYRPGVLGHSAAHGHVAYIARVNPDGSLFIENYGLGRYYTTEETATLLNPLIAAGMVNIRHSTILDRYLAEHPSVGSVDSSDIQRVKDTGRTMMRSYGWESPTQFDCLDRLWMRESGWRASAENPDSGAYGIPQALPASKLAAAGKDWRTNPVTQIRWGLGYIQDRYGSPCGAWAHSQAHNWY